MTIKYQTLSQRRESIASRRQSTTDGLTRSKSYNEIIDAQQDPHEVTPLLLTARLNELLRVPIDHGKKVA